MQFDDNDRTLFLGNSGSSAAAPPPGETVHVSTGGAARSAVYVAQQASVEEFSLGLNPLVNYAGRLLIEIVHLRSVGSEGASGQGEAWSGLEELRRRLEAEIRCFEAQALGAEIDHSQVLAAKYVLCTALDESVSTSPMGSGGGMVPTGAIEHLSQRNLGRREILPDRRAVHAAAGKESLSPRTHIPFAQPRVRGALQAPVPGSHRTGTAAGKNISPGAHAPRRASPGSVQKTP